MCQSFPLQDLSPATWDKHEAMCTIAPLRAFMEADDEVIHQHFSSSTGGAGTPCAMVTCSRACDGTLELHVREVQTAISIGHKFIYRALCYGVCIESSATTDRNQLAVQRMRNRKTNAGCTDNPSDYTVLFFATCRGKHTNRSLASCCLFAACASIGVDACWSVWNVSQGRQKNFYSVRRGRSS